MGMNVQDPLKQSGLVVSLRLKPSEQLSVSLVPCSTRAPLSCPSTVPLVSLGTSHLPGGTIHEGKGIGQRSSLRANFKFHVFVMFFELLAAFDELLLTVNKRTIVIN